MKINKLATIKYLLYGTGIGLLITLMIMFLAYFTMNKMDSEVPLMSFLEFLLDTADPKIKMMKVATTPMVIGFSVVISHFFGRAKENNRKIEEYNKYVMDTNEKIKNIDKTKTELIASYSHELKTPLTSSRGYLELLISGECGKLSPETQSKLGETFANLQYLTKLIGEVIDIAKLDSNKMKWDIRETEIKDLVNDVKNKYQEKMEKKNIVFSVKVPKFYLVIDQIRLTQILSELLDNSMEGILESGKISLDVKIEDGTAIFKIKDNGIGIPKWRLKEIFNRNYEGKYIKEGSTCLGLALCKELLNKFKGKIKVHSHFRKGTTVEFMIPGAIIK